MPSSARLLGFVVDGVTSQKLNAFPDSSSKLANLGNDKSAHNEVYAIVGGSYRRAQPCGQGDITAANLITAEGCYRFEALPVNTPIPLFAQFDGYDSFLSTVTIPVSAPVSGSTGASVTQGPQPDPELIGNIRLFAKGFQTDYKFTVLTALQPVPDAVVNCQRLVTQLETFQTAGTFLTPDSTLTDVVTATTDATGKATLPGAQLVNGATYSCRIYGTFQGHEVASPQQQPTNFTAGVSQQEQVVTLSASTNSSALFALSSNVDSGQLVGVGGKLVISLNQPAEILPGTVDCQTAALFAADRDGDGNAVPTLPAPTLNNSASESMTATMSSDGLTLTLGYTNLQGTLDLNDLGTSVSFAGVFIRPLATNEQRLVYNVGNSAGSGSATCSLGSAYGTYTFLQNEELANGPQPSTMTLY